MGPDRSNYEIWLIDYLDGNLDQEKTGLLIAFLEKNPDIKEEVADMAPVLLQPGNDQFINKKGLRKESADLTGQQFELLCVASAEGDLNPDQESELEEILSSSPAHKKTYDLIRSTRLKPRDLTFRYKYRLRKLTTGQKIFRYSLIGISSAAVLLIMISIFRRTPPTLPLNEIATVKRDTLVDIPSGKVITRPSGGAVALKINVEKANAPAVYKLTPDQETKKIMLAENALEINRIDSSPAEIHKTFVSKIDYSHNDFIVNHPVLTLAEIKITEVSDEPDMEYSRLRNFIARFLREKVIKSDYKEKGSLKGYEIADAGIIGLNKLLGWDMSLQKNRNDKGEVMSVHFNSKLLKFNAPVKTTSE